MCIQREPAQDALHVHPEVGCILASIFHGNVGAARVTTVLFNELGDIVHSPINHDPRILDHLVALDLVPANQPQRAIRMCVVIRTGINSTGTQLLDEMAQPPTRHAFHLRT